MSKAQSPVVLDLSNELKHLLIFFFIFFFSAVVEVFAWVSSQVDYLVFKNIWSDARPVCSGDTHLYFLYYMFFLQFPCSFFKALRNMLKYS